MIPKAEKHAEKIESSWWEYKTVYHTTLENNLAISFKTKHTHTVRLSNYCHGLFHRTENLCVDQTCTWLFTEILFVVVRTWKQLTCYSPGKQLKKSVTSILCDTTQKLKGINYYYTNNS